MEYHNIEFDGIFTGYYETYAARLLRYVSRIIGDEDTAQELVHDLFLKIFERRIVFDISMDETGFFLFKMARNMAYDLLRKKLRQNARFDDIVFQDVCLNERFYRDVESVYIEGEVISTLRDTLNELPERSREVIVKRGMEDMNLVDVVRETSLSKYHVSRIEREAMGILRAKLERRIGDWRVAARSPLTREWKT